ncbi:hypothetical protein NQ317_000250, partial [Molorchus minor]
TPKWQKTVLRLLPLNLCKLKDLLHLETKKDFYLERNQNQIGHQVPSDRTLPTNTTYFVAYPSAKYAKSFPLPKCFPGFTQLRR